MVNLFELDSRYQRLP